MRHARVLALALALLIAGADRGFPQAGTSDDEEAVRRQELEEVRRRAQENRDAAKALKPKETAAIGQLRRSERQCSFTQTVRHELQHFFSRSRHDRNHDQCQRHSARERRKMFHRQNQDRVDKNSGNDRRNTRQRVHNETHRSRQSPATNLRQVNSHTNSQRQPEGRGN